MISFVAFAKNILQLDVVTKMLATEFAGVKIVRITFHKRVCMFVSVDMPVVV